MKETMRAVVLDATGIRLVTDYPMPQPAPGEALIRVLCTGICNTDLELIKGYMSFRGVLGHEFVGRVEVAPDPTWVGQRVVGEINAACFTCSTCRAGQPSHCPNRTTLGIDRRDGALAEYLTLPVACLHRIPVEIPDDVAVFTEPLAAALQVPNLVHIQPTDRVAVIGDGKLGLLAAQVLLLTGCEVILLGRHAHKLALAAEMGLATRLVQSVPEDALSSFDTVVECSGNPAGFELAHKLVRPRGTIVLKSTYYDHSELNLSQLVVQEIRAIGSRCGPFEPALRLLQSGRVQVKPLLQARYPLDQALTALDQAAISGSRKILVEM